jgi:uncharacterized membrane-anchored protein YitT (DUF2179 family)
MKQHAYSIIWNLCLITLGAAIFSVGVKAVAVNHGFITGGVSGLGLLLFYLSGKMGPGSWYFLLNIPLVILGWFGLSRRFVLYTLYGMTCLSLGMDFVPFSIHLNDPLLAAIFSGAIMGAGAGIVLRSLGSAGGTDILAVLLNQKFSMRIGQISFFFNLALFSICFYYYDIHLVFYSIILSFVASVVTEYFLSMFNQRKAVLIITELPDEIAMDIMKKVRRGAPFINGVGAYSGKPRKIILTVTNNIQLKRLEEVVFSRDPNAFFIVENTFNVLGGGFSKRKKY